MLLRNKLLSAVLLVRLLLVRIICIGPHLSLSPVTMGAPSINDFLITFLQPSLVISSPIRVFSHARPFRNVVFPPFSLPPTSRYCSHSTVRRLVRVSTAYRVFALLFSYFVKTVMFKSVRSQCMHLYVVINFSI